MDWKISLDKYLTAEPDDGFTGWCELVNDSFSDDFYQENEDWIHESSGQCNEWLNRLFNEGKDPLTAAQIIENDFKLRRL